jgi:Ca-activated chloride channel family protein
MRKILFVLICLAFLGTFISAQTTRDSRPRVITPNSTNSDKKTDDDVVEDDGEVIKIETNLITIPVSVFDRDGRFISNLQQADFQIFENNVEQKIDYFASIENPFTVVLLIDVSPSTQYKIEEIQDAAINFVNQLRNNDKVVVISFDERVHVLSPATSNRNVLRNAIRQADFGDGTGLYEAVDYAINQQLRRIEGRKAIVLFTDGVDTTSQRASYQSTIREAEGAETLIYPIRYDTFSGGGFGGGRGGGGNFPRNRRNGGGGIGGILGDILGGVGGGNNRTGGGGGGGTGNAGGNRQDYEVGKRYLETLAQNSGGKAFDANNDLSQAFTEIAAELRQQYSIGYYPANAGRTGERKSIRVRVKRPNLTVRAKNSYIVGEK